jgi:hypothetical protein
MGASVFEELRHDLATLRIVIARSRDEDVPDNRVLEACANVFAEKRERLQSLEAATWEPCVPSA